MTIPEELEWYSYMHTYVALPVVTGSAEMADYEEWLYLNNLGWRTEWDYCSIQSGLDDYLNSIRFKNPEDAVAFKLRFQL